MRLELAYEVRIDDPEIDLSQNWVPVLAHPERYAGIGLTYDWIARWRTLGAVMCLNVGSLFGEHGVEAERVARRMLASGHADLIASDHHARPRRSTTLRQGWDLLAEGEPSERREAVRTLMVSNPLALLSGGALLPVPAIDFDGGWFDRVKRRLLGDTR
jgi:protein-tyrosine phosphatase